MMGPTSGDQGDVLIPQTGAAKYWYVDPRAQGVPTPSSNQPFDPVAYEDERGHTDTASQPEPSTNTASIEDALKRIFATQWQSKQ